MNKFITTLLSSFLVLTPAIAQVIPGPGPFPLTPYSEGTWTPTIAFGGASSGVTYSAQRGSWTRIGNRYFINGYILLSSKGSSTGSTTVSLPVASSNISNNYSSCSMYIASSASTLITTTYAYIGPNSSTINLTKMSAGTTSAVSNSDITNTSEIMVNCQYQIAGN